MSDITHPQLVEALVKNPSLIAGQLTNAKVDLIHATMGISGEAGELLDAIKKHVIYDKPLHTLNVIEELGDMEFYMEQLRQRLGITREQTLEANIAKLKVRYNGLKYSDVAAQQRADKVEGPVRKPFPGEPEHTYDEVLKMARTTGHVPEGWGMEDDGDDVMVWKKAI
jgi:NTP pyrophosphatase (non-canonical NTP hydrolase)